MKTIQSAHPSHHYSRFVATCRLWWRGRWAHWIVFMTSLYMYYALSFMLVEHSVRHEPIFVLINVYEML